MVNPHEDPLELVSSRHDEWVDRFIDERDRLRDLLTEHGYWHTVERIHHVGSTAVPGLEAKDIVDIDIVVSKDAVFDVSRLIETELGGSRTENSPTWHPVFRSVDGQRFNDHVFASSCPEWKVSVVTRDVLRARPSHRREYTRLKRQLLLENSSLEAYSVGKTAFMEELLSIAHEDAFFEYPFEIPRLG